jgi:hypothetical protein
VTTCATIYKDALVRSDTLLFNGPTTCATIYKDPLVDRIHSFLMDRLHGHPLGSEIYKYMLADRI